MKRCDCGWTIDVPNHDPACALVKAGLVKATGIVSRVYGIKARFCHEGCRESYKCDRDHGLIYGPYRLESGRIVGVDEASLALWFCAYCSTSLEGGKDVRGEDRKADDDPAGVRPPDVHPAR